jgi:drug/metabolite transporter (DMT)-like permease
VPVAALLLTIVLWGSAFPAIRAALTGYSAAQLSVARLLVAAVALGLVAVLRGVRLPARRDVPAIAGVGFAGMTAYQLLLNSGERTVPAGTASLLVNVSPVLSAIAAAVLLGERITPRAKLGIGIAFSGAALIAVTGEGGLRLSSGALLVLGAAVAQATFFVAQKPLLRRYGSLELTAWAMALGALLTLPLAGGLPHAVAAAPARATLAILFLGLGASAIGFVAWAWASARLDVSTAAVTLYAVPVVATGIGWAWLGETPRPVTVAGGAIALAGVFLATRSAGIHRSSVDASASQAERGAIGRASSGWIPSERGRSVLATACGGEAPRESVNPGLRRAQAEPAQEEERTAAERAALRQHAELDGRVIGVEECADAVQPPLAQLAEEHHVDDDEPVGRREPAERRPVGAEQLRGSGGVRAVAQSRARRVEARVGEG